MEEDNDGHPGLAATQYDMMRDNGFEHLNHADEDDKRATQRLQQRDRQSNRAGAVANNAAKNGILESIQCLNFMCHDNLKVELGPLLNFIVGENGSGKSAVLTAITICLGGKASSTNRGGSLKNFIKEGRDKCKLIVKIKNQGRDAYQHELYGDAILVERNFSRAGNSGFSIKSETGRIISSRKRDVDEIVEYYCLQVDNPLNVLSQDNARQFLNASTAKQKYRFFLQGVQLQQLDDDFRVIEEYLNANEHKEGDLQVKVEVSKKEYEKAKREFLLLKESDAMKDERRLLRRKHMWAQIIDKERELAELQRRVSEADLCITEGEQRFERQTETLTLVDQEIARFEHELVASKEENEELSINRERAKAAAQAAKKQLSDLMTEQRDAQSSLKNSDRERKELEGKIAEEKQRLEDLNGNIVTEKNEQLEAARAREAQVDQELIDAKNRLPDLVKNQQQAQEECEKVDRSIFQKKQDINGAEGKIRQIQQGQGSLYDAYPPNTQRLLQMIEADAGFERKPVGPIGAHIQVLEPMWSPMLEKFIGDSLNGFVVTSKRDSTRLRDMMNRLGIKSPILIGNATPINTSPQEPDALYTTILRILKIEDSLIRNQLIINNRIEKTILVQTKEDADRIMLSSGGPPRNVNACYHPLRSKGPGWTVRLTVNANGASSSPQQPPASHLKSRLKSDARQEATLYQQRVTQFQEELRDLQKQKAQQVQSRDRRKKEIDECNSSVKRLAQDKLHIQAKINTILTELDAFEDVDSRLQLLNNQLKMTEEKLDQLKSEYGTIGLRKSEKNVESEELQAKLRAESRKLKDFEDSLSKAEDKIRRAKDSRELAVVAKNEAYEEHEMAKIRKERLEEERNKLQGLVTDWTARAEASHPRIEIRENESFQIIEKKLESITKTLQERERKRGMTDEEVSQRSAQAQVAYSSLKQAYNQVCKENRALKSTLLDRLRKWRLFQRYISSGSRANFMYLLSERDFRGRLILDHKNHTLEVQVEPDKTRKNAAARNTKTLSGGEKSFSSICLLLAIWEAMGSPLRCLDEFDVYMDNVNREVSTDMLVSSLCFVNSWRITELC